LLELVTEKWKLVDDSERFIELLKEYYQCLVKYIKMNGLEIADIVEIANMTSILCS